MRPRRRAQNRRLAPRRARRTAKPSRSLCATAQRKMKKPRCPRLFLQAKTVETSVALAAVVLFAMDASALVILRGLDILLFARAHVTVRASTRLLAIDPRLAALEVGG